MSSNANKRVAIVMGSKSDLKIMSQAAKTLAEFKIPNDVQIVSAHRTPEEMQNFALTAHEKYAVIIAGAGGAAHLPGMIASLTRLPVIGVPVTTTGLKGLDALLSIAQMPAGVPVATMAVDNAVNAGLLAARILGLSHGKIAKKLDDHREGLKKKVRSMRKELKKAKA